MSQCSWSIVTFLYNTHLLIVEIIDCDLRVLLLVNYSFFQFLGDIPSTLGDLLSLILLILLGITSR